MGKTVKIECDTCGKDLTRTGNCVDYRLIVAAENIQTVGGFVTAMGKYPAVDRTYYFCALPCMDKWRDRARFRAKLWEKWNEEWKREHGTQHDNYNGGKYWLYPEPPAEIMAARDAEFEAAALAAIP